MDEPKGIVYVDVDIDDNSKVNTADMMRIALGWSPDPAINSSKSDYSNSRLMNIT
jgi:hypothetical protein